MPASTGAVDAPRGVVTAEGHEQRAVGQHVRPRELPQRLRARTHAPTHRRHMQGLDTVPLSKTCVPHPTPRLRIGRDACAGAGVWVGAARIPVASKQRQRCSSLTVQSQTPNLSALDATFCVLADFAQQHAVVFAVATGIVS